AAAVDLIDVALDRGFEADVVEVGRAEVEDDVVELAHGPLEQIADLVEARIVLILIGMVAVGSIMAVAIAVTRTGDAHGLGLVQRAGDERRDGVVDIGSDAAALVFLEADRAAEEVAQALCLAGDLLARCFGVADLGAEAISHLADGAAEGGGIARADG